MKILMYDNGLPFDLKTPYHNPLGGSETTFLLLAKALSLLNHQVVLLTNINYKDQDKNIIVNNNSYFSEYAKITDIIIFNRTIPEQVLEFINTDKKLFYMAHDAYDQDSVKWMMNNNSTQLLDKIICVSNWQKQSFINYLSVDPNKLVVLGNPIDYSLYYGHTNRDPYKLIFSSIPFKGLEILPELFNEIKFNLSKQNKQISDKLSLDIYSSFEMYHRQEEDNKYNDIFRQLSNISGVNIYNSISMKELIFKFKQSSFYIAPSLYHETFGRVFVESMACGCLPITVNNGANKEIIGDNGYILNYANIYNSDCFNNFVDLTVSLLQENLYQKRSQVERDMQKWDYIKLSKQLEYIILD